MVDVHIYTVHITIITIHKTIMLSNRVFVNLVNAKTVCCAHFANTRLPGVSLVRCRRMN